MFRRRQPLPLFRWLHGLVWPRTGWRRLGIYTLKRLTRLPGTPYSIAAGAACGVAISFTPFMGFHLLLTALLALLIRANLLAAVAGTLVGNPWTFPFIWLLTYQVGRFLLGGSADATGPSAPGSFADLISYVGEAARLVTTAGLIVTVKRLVADVGLVFWPMTVGSVPLGLAAGLATYFPLVRVVAAYQEARQRRRERRRRRDQRRAQLKAAGARTDAGVT